MTECPGNDEGLDFTGHYLPLRLRSGDTLSIDTEISLSSGLTLSSQEVKVYDADGVEQTGITETATAAGNVVTWGLLSPAETATLDPDTDYTYVFRVTLSNSEVRSVYYGPLRVSPASGRGVVL
jgi:hypothetical protein